VQKVQTSIKRNHTSLKASPSKIFLIIVGCRGWEYPGEEVWRLQVETTAQMEALATLEAAHRMDFWTEVR
jgi:hypothetical protein